MIVAVDGKSVTGAQDVVDAVGAKQPGDTVSIEYYRGNDKHTASVKLGERPEVAQLEQLAAAVAERRRPAVQPAVAAPLRLRALRV